MNPGRFLKFLGILIVESYAAAGFGMVRDYYDCLARWMDAYMSLLDPMMLTLPLHTIQYTGGRHPRPIGGCRPGSGSRHHGSVHHHGRCARVQYMRCLVLSPSPKLATRTRT